MAALDLYDAAVELLDAAVDAVALSPGGPIAVSYVSEGLPAFDCPEQITVHAGGPAEAETQPTSPVLQPGHRRALGIAVNLVSLTITVIRCAAVPNAQGNVPVAAHETPARQTMGDVWTIWNHLDTLKTDGVLFPPADCRELFFDGAVLLTTSGGAAGWEIPVRVQLDGYRTI